MVKKTGLFERLFGHKKDESPRQGMKGSGRSLASPGVGGRTTPKGSPGDRGIPKPGVAPRSEAKAPGTGRVAPVAPGVSRGPEAGGAAETAPKPKAPEAEVSSVRRVLGGKKEEAMQALTDGFQNLSKLLEGIQGNLDSQGKRAEDLNEKVADLPVLAKAQVDFLTKVSGQLETQTARTGELLSKLSGLPDLLDGIHKTLEKQVAAEERSEKTLQDFRKTMNEIHDSIGDLTRKNSEALKASTESLERTNKRTAQTFEKAQSQAYASFERAQKANLSQLSAIMERSTKMNRTMIVLLAVLFAGLAVLFVLVLNGQAG